MLKHWLACGFVKAVKTHENSNFQLWFMAKHFAAISSLFLSKLLLIVPAQFQIQHKATAYLKSLTKTNMQLNCNLTTYNKINSFAILYMWLPKN